MQREALRTGAREGTVRVLAAVGALGVLRAFVDVCRRAKLEPTACTQLHIGGGGCTLTPLFFFVLCDNEQHAKGGISGECSKRSPHPYFV